jgi:heme-degrading monooxygenase HmoA
MIPAAAFETSRPAGLFRFSETRYASYTEWESEEAFWAWTGSAAFRRAHANGAPKGVVAGHAVLECWDAVLEESAPESA